VPDPLHPLHRHDVGACELPLPRELEPVALAMRQEQQSRRPASAVVSWTKSSTRGAWLPAVVIRTFGRVASCSRVARKAKEEISQPAFWTWPSSLTA
jgi:hypothetical protein